MSVSFSVRTDVGAPIDAVALRRETNRAFRELLCREATFALDIEFQRFSPRERVDAIVPAGELYVLDERSVLGYGLLLGYEPPDEGGREEFEFYVTEIARRTDDALLAVSSAVCVGAARLLGAGAITDYAGVFGAGDEVPISHLLAIAVDRPLPLNDALAQFYAHLRVA
jgi:hypothetical protein